VVLIWAVAFLLTAAFLIWLPVRLVFPRREMFFTYRQGGRWPIAGQRGGGKRHSGISHEALDSIEAGNTATLKDTPG